MSFFPSFFSPHPRQHLLSLVFLITVIPTGVNDLTSKLIRVRGQSDSKGARRWLWVTALPVQSAGGGSFQGVLLFSTRAWGVFRTALWQMAAVALSEGISSGFTAVTVTVNVLLASVCQGLWEIGTQPATRGCLGCGGEKRRGKVSSGSSPCCQHSFERGNCWATFKAKIKGAKWMFWRAAWGFFWEGLVNLLLHEMQIYSKCLKYQLWGESIL